MSSISSNSYLNNKRQSNAWKTAAVVARHRQFAFQIHWDSSAQSSSSAHLSSSKMMLQERDFNTNVIQREEKYRSSLIEISRAEFMSVDQHLLRILSIIDRDFDRDFPSMAGRHLLRILTIIDRGFSSMTGRHLLEILPTIERGFPGMTHECWPTPSGNIDHIGRAFPSMAHECWAAPSKFMRISSTTDRGFPSMATDRDFSSMAHECWSAPSEDTDYHW